MKQIQKFNVKEIPFTNIVFAITTNPDYEMERLLVLEDYPEDGKYLILEGYHCSCYGFDGTEWGATIVSPKEFLKLIENWNSGLEATLKPLIKSYLETK